ncbi:MAG: VOC family protein [Bacteroidales bacterium]|nr:VOC family protein [Bacteroidales bacterium]
MSKNVVNWFEIPVSDIERAVNFYSSVFEIKLEKLPMPGTEMFAFPWQEGGENSTGALVKQNGYEPSDKGSMVYFTCEDVTAELGRVELNGGKIVTPKSSIGEHGFIAHAIDSEGNKIGLHSVK